MLMLFLEYILVELLMYLNDNNLPFSQQAGVYNGCRVGPLATIRCKPRQARKGAAVAADSCAGMWLARFPPIIII